MQKLGSMHRQVCMLCNPVLFRKGIIADVGHCCGSCLHHTGATAQICCTMSQSTMRYNQMRPTCLQSRGFDVNIPTGRQSGLTASLHWSVLLLYSAKRIMRLNDTEGSCTVNKTVLYRSTLKVTHVRRDASASAHAMNDVTPPNSTRTAVMSTFASSSQFRVLKQLPNRHLKTCNMSVRHSVRV